MSKPIQLSDEVYGMLKPYTNDCANRSKQKVSFSSAIKKLIIFRERD